MNTETTKDLYNEWLDETNDTVSINGLEYKPSEVFKEIDPIAYRQGYLDFTDSLPDNEAIDDEEEF